MPFIQRIIKELIKNDKDISKIAIVAPNKRFSLFFKKYLKENPQIKKPLWIPDIFSIQEFVENISSYKLVDNFSLIFYLYESYTKIAEAPISFDTFYQWGKTILKDFNDIEHSMCPENRLFDNIVDFQEIDSLYAEDTNFIITKYYDLVKTMRALYYQFNQDLQKKNAGYYGLILKRILKNKEITDKHFSKWEVIIFAGFDYLTPAENQLIDLVGEKTGIDIFWEIDEYFFCDESQEAGDIFRQNPLLIQEKKKQKVGSADLKNSINQSEINWIDRDLTEKKKNIKLYAVPGNVAQAKVLGNVFKKKNNTAIILPDENLLFPILHSIPENIEKINITMGYPLKNTNTYNLFSYIIEMHENRYRLEIENKTYHKDIKQILTHPFFYSLYPKVINEILENIVKKNLIYVGKEELNSLPEEIAYIFAPVENIDLYSEFLINILQSIRSIIQTQNPRAIELEYIYKFFVLLQRLGDAIREHNINMKIMTYRRLFREIASTAKMPFHGEPLQGLQVMGILETRSLSFENIYILSANEGFLPPQKPMDSLIPYEIKKAYNLPTHEAIDSIYAYLLYRLIKNAKNINILYNTESDSLGKGEKSRFIEQLKEEYFKKNDNIDLQEYICSFKQETTTENNIIIPKTEKTLKKMQEMSWSATSLNTYLTCSLRFYFQYILKLKETEQVYESTDARLFGSIIHKTLEELLPALTVITPEYKNDIHKSIEPVLKRHYHKEISNVSFDKGKNFLNLEIMKELISKVIEKEKCGTKILKTEKAYYYNCYIDNKIIRFYGKIDRIDESGGVLRLIDYKTGATKALNIDSSLNEIDEILSCFTDNKHALQLLLYLVLIKNEPLMADKKVKSCIYSLRNISKTSSLSYLKQKPKKNILFEKDHIRQFEKVIKKLLIYIMNDQDPFTQVTDLNKCRYCPFLTICGRD